MGIRSGELNKRAVLQRRTSTQDALGGTLQTWADVAEIWCGIDTASGRELMAAQALRVEVSHTIICRYRPQFANPVAAASLRLVFKGRYFNIMAAMNENERNEKITLLCTEGLNDG